MNSNLIDLRKQIDECDAELIQLLAKRFAITNKVGQLKQQNNINSIDPAREARQFKRIAILSKQSGVEPELSQRILRNIIDQVVIEHEAIKNNNVKNLVTMPNVGIIGMGDFGKLARRHLKATCRLKCFDANPKNSTHSFAEVMQSEFVILAVPLSSIEAVLKQIKPLLKPSTTLIDICSVKQNPTKLFAKVIPKHKNVVFTHPMFGPQSASRGLAGHTLIFTNNNTAAKRVRDFCQQTLGLKIVNMTVKEHDRVMASMHALTFFIARGLNNFGLKPSRFQAPSFQMLLDLVALDKAQSQELFETVECGNPLASAVRQKFIKQLQKIDDDLC